VDLVVVVLLLLLPLLPLLVLLLLLQVWAAPGVLVGAAAAAAAYLAGAFNRRKGLHPGRYVWKEVPLTILVRPNQQGPSR